MMVKLTKAQAWLGIIATVLAIIGGMGYAWNKLGWVTPNQHEEDIKDVKEESAALQEPVLSAISALSTKMDVNQDEWKCDEYSEALVDLLERQVTDASAQLSVEIESLRNAIDARECTRFEN